MKKIITHAGKAHLDDLMAVALGYVKTTYPAAPINAATPPEARINALKETLKDVIAVVPFERRDPTPEELEDPDVLVVDVGGRHEPEKSNYDHHQFARGTRKSAMSILADDMAFDEGVSFREFLTAVYPWFETRVVVDACGPFQAAKESEMTWDAVAQFLGPCEELVLKLFEAGNRTVVRLLAEDILEKAEAFDAVGQAMKFHNVDGVNVFDFTPAPVWAVDAVSDANTRSAEGGVAVFHDNRGDGLTLLRLKDDPRVDFTRVKDDPEVAFAHPGGFICKTKTKNPDEALRLIRAAVKA